MIVRVRAAGLAPDPMPLAPPNPGPDPGALMNTHQTPCAAVYLSLTQLRLWPARTPAPTHTRRVRGPAALDRSCSVCVAYGVYSPRRSLFLTPLQGRAARPCLRASRVLCPSLRSIAQHCAALRAATHLPATQTPLLRTDAALFTAQWPGRHPVRPCAHGFTSCPRWSATVRSGPRGPAHDSHAMPRFDARRAWVVARRLSRRPNAHRCSHRQLSVTNAVTMRHGHLSDTPIARTRHRNDRASAEGGARIRCGPVLPTSCGCRCPPAQYRKTP